MQKDLILCFIDYKKAFDTVRHADLLEIMNTFDIGKKDFRVRGNLYYEQTTAIRVEDELTDWVNIERGVRSGCVMSLILFSLYGKIIMRNNANLERIRRGGQYVNSIRYADEEKIRRIINEVDAAGEKMRLKINRSKMTA